MITTGADLRLIQLQQDALKLQPQHRQASQLLPLYNEILQCVHQLGFKPVFSLDWFITSTAPPQIFLEQFVRNVVEHLIESGESLRQKDLLVAETRLLTLAQAQNDLIRNQKGIRTLLRMLKSTMQSKGPITEFDIELLQCLCTLMASLTTTKKNAEYILVKRGETLFQLIIQGSKDATTTDSALATLANLCIGNDQRLLLWSSGTLNWAMHQYHLPSALWLTLKIIYDCAEPANDLCSYVFSQKEFLGLLESAIISFTPLTAVCVALIRKTAEQCQQMRDHFTTTRMMQLLNLQSSDLQHQLFIYKEVFSFIGLLCIHNKPFIEQQPAGSIISLDPNVALYSTIFQRLCQYDDPKLARAGLGCLTNLSANEKVLKVMVADKGLYLILQRVLENDHDKPQIIEYALKLISNSLSNQTVIMLISQPKYLIKLLFIWTLNQTNLAITNQIIKIAKQMQAQSSKFVGLLISCVQELETTNPAFSLLGLYVINLQRNIEQQRYEYVGENLMMLSILSSNSKPLNTKIAQSQQVKMVCQQYLKAMTAQGNGKKALQVVSCLPIEEMDFDSELT